MNGGTRALEKFLEHEEEKISIVLIRFILKVGTRSWSNWFELYKVPATIE
jgi:hypothetical protein